MKQFFFNLTDKIKQFADSLYLNSAIPPVNSKAVVYILTISLLMILLGTALWFYFNKLGKVKEPYYELRNKFSGLFITSGILYLVWLFFYWQSIPYLASTMLALIIFIIFISWLLVISLYIQRKFFWELDQFERHERYKKYLPRPKSAGLPRSKKERKQ